MNSQRAQVLEEIAKVLDIEIEALQLIRNNVSEEFALAVEMIGECRGQLYVTGIGKSGIIARKIAATFRSTGTPATFLHAAEALHGDVGIINSDDVVLAVGKTGETTELNHLLRAVKKQGTRIIALTSSGSSSMAALSDLILNLNVIKEACPLNLAPTASTTAAVAVGDALAVALMKQKNISVDDFARHHPGGQIGKRLLLTVEDIMRKGEDNPVISVRASIKEMLVKITAFRVGAISVIGEEGEFLGLVTDYDVRKVLESDKDIRAVQIQDVMNSGPLVIDAQAKAIEALELMRAQRKPLAVLPVVNGHRKVVGMIHLHDLVAAGL